MIQQFKESLVAAIQTVPIIYIPHFHFSYIDEIVEEVLSADSSKRLLNFGVESVSESYANMTMCDFKTKDLIASDVCLNDILKEVVTPLPEPEDGRDKRVLRQNYKLFLFKNMHENLSNKDTQLYLQTFVEKYERGIYDDSKTIIFVSNVPISLLPPEVSKLLTVINLPLPDAEDIEAELGISDIVLERNGWRPNKPYSYNGYVFGNTFMESDASFKKNRKVLVGALLGMQMYDIRKVLKSIQKLEEFINPHYAGKTLAEHILREKRQLVNNSNMLEVIDLAGDQKDRIGNINNLKHFIEKQQIIINNLAYYPSNLPKPKGVLLVGPPGCGKSETVKSVAAIFEKPLLRLDIGRLMGQYVGQSEHNLIEAIRIAEAAQPCVLWIDEIEKAFAGFGNNNQDNDITVTRMVGYFLTWMQERKSLVYLVATANDLSSLRPEFLRKGRWDEIFYLSYPDKKGAKEILQKCLKKYGLYLADGNKIIISLKGEIVDSQSIENLAKQLADAYFSGAEIDSLIVQSFNDDWNLTENNRVQLSTLLKFVKSISDNKVSAEQETRKNEIDELLLNFKLSAGKKNLPNEAEIKELLNIKLKSKSPLEVISEYKSKGYISAS